MMSQRNCALAVCGVNIITDRHGYKNGECFCPILHASETMSITEMPKQLIRTHTIGDRNGGTHTHTQRDDRSQNAWQSIRLGQDLHRQSTNNKKNIPRPSERSNTATDGRLCLLKMQMRRAVWNEAQERGWTATTLIKRILFYYILRRVYSRTKKKKIENNKWP